MIASCQSAERDPVIRNANRHQRRLDEIVGAKLGNSRARSAATRHTSAAARRGPGHAVAEDGNALTQHGGRHRASRLQFGQQRTCYDRDERKLEWISAES